MFIRSLITSACLILLLAGLGTRDASAFTGVTNLTYTVSSGVLSGYSDTFKDPGDPNSGSICVRYVQDEVGNLYCVEYLYLEYYVAVVGTLYEPGFSQYSSSSSVGWLIADVGYSVNQPAGGVWTAIGQHYALEDIYQCLWDEVFGWVCYYVGTNTYHFGDTEMQVGVARCSTATVNQAAINVTRSWPAREPFERAVTIYCVGPDVLTFGNYNDSFGEIYTDFPNPTNDPCATRVYPQPDGNSAGAHSHPYFTSAAQYKRGAGCHGQNWYTPSPSELATLNQQNVNFSDGDIAAFRCQASPLYVRSPNADSVRKLQGTPSNCRYSNVRVYP